MKLAHILSLTVLALATGCAATPADQEDADGQGVSADEAIKTGLTTGTFKLYEEPGHVPSGCDIYTKLVLSNPAKATLSEQVGGMCMIALLPNVRSIRLHQTGGTCGTKIYEGSVAVKGGVDTVKITDNRGRMCLDAIAARVIVEETVPGFPGPITTTKYSLDAAPAAAEVTVEGSLFHSVGIGGENTGSSIRSGKDVFELVLDASEQKLFVPGKLARVKGTKTELNGVETHNRPAINVEEILSCPDAGAIDCMPPVSGAAASLCAPANRTWIESKCAGVSYLD